MNKTWVGPFIFLSVYQGVKPRPAEFLVSTFHFGFDAVPTSSSLSQEWQADFVVCVLKYRNPKREPKKKKNPNWGLDESVSRMPAPFTDQKSYLLPNPHHVGKCKP